MREESSGHAAGDPEPAMDGLWTCIYEALAEASEIPSEPLLAGDRNAPLGELGVNSLALISALVMIEGRLGGNLADLPAEWMAPATLNDLRRLAERMSEKEIPS